MDVPIDMEVTRATELPQADLQQRGDTAKQSEVIEFRDHPGFKHIEAKLEGYIAKYRTPVMPADMPYDEVGREYRMSQTVAGRLQEVLDDIRG